MDDLRIGRLLRALRLRRGWRQIDLALAAGVSQSLISLIERGHLARLSVDTVRRVFAAVDARYEGTVSWRGGAIDRLLDERHAALVGRAASELRDAGWQVELEVTFNVYGDRGSIDILGLRRDRGQARVVEVKTEITSIEETLRRLDVKARLVPGLVQDRFGWQPVTRSRLLVVQDSTTNRRRVAAHTASLGAALPGRSVAVRRWLRDPEGRLSGLRFLSNTNPRGPRSGSRVEWGPRRADSPSRATGVGR
jgi:transcriptional regulator with XRE-family HTH domain